MKKDGRKTNTIILLSMAGITLALGFLIFVTFNKSITNLVNSFAKNNMITSIETKSQIFEEYIQKSETILRVFAKSPELKECLKNPNDKDLVAKAQKYTMDFYGDLVGWEGIYLNSWNSVVLTHSNPEKIGMRTRKGEQLAVFQKKIMRNKKWVFNGGVITAPLTNVIVMPLFAPVFDDDGCTILGFVGGAIENEQFAKLLAEAKIPNLDSAKYSLVDFAQARYIYSEESAKVGHDIDEKHVDEIFKQINMRIYRGTCNYEDDKGRDCVCVYKFIPDRQWLFIIKDEAEEIYSSAVKINSFKSINLLQNFLMASIIILLACTILREIRNASKLEKINNRYQTVTSKTLSVVFEYDAENGMLEMNGGTEPIFGENCDRISKSELDRIYSRLHPDDGFMHQKLKDLLCGDAENITCEIRIRDFEDKYMWYRLSAALICDESGRKKLFGNFVNADEQIEKAKRLKKDAETDLLSGLLNKMTMEQKTEEILEGFSGSETLVFFMIDLDNFKKVNDSLGHRMGDRAICDVAGTLNRVFTDNDLIARIGGDEFSVLLRIKSKDMDFVNELVKVKAENLIRKLRRTYSNGKKRVELTSSIGIKCFDHEKSYQELYENADTALYESKENGKNQYTVKS